MALQNLVRTALVAVLLVVVTAVGSAQASDLWTVANVGVDATGPNPSAAKEAALAQGRQKAWSEVFRRLTPSSVWSRQPKLTDLELEPMVKSFDIASEKHSSTRYLAAVTYVFNPAGVRAALRRSGTPFSESMAKPVLVVPLNGAAWAPKESAWGGAWVQQSRRGRLVPVAVPTGDLEDMTSLATVSSAADWPTVKQLADRYGASSVLVASAGKSAKGMQVGLTHIRADGRGQRNVSFTPQGAEDEAALSLRASGAIAESLQEEWKQTTSVDYGQQTSITVSVPFRGLPDWVSLKRSLETTSVIQNVVVEEVSMASARVRMDYVGKVEQLQTALAQTNLSLVADAGGNWTLSRNAAAAPG